VRFTLALVMADSLDDIVGQRGHEVRVKTQVDSPRFASHAVLSPTGSDILTEFGREAGVEVPHDKRRRRPRTGTQGEENVNPAGNAPSDSAKSGADQHDGFGRKASFDGSTAAMDAAPAPEAPPLSRRNRTARAAAEAPHTQEGCGAAEFGGSLTLLKKKVEKMGRSHSSRSRRVAKEVRSRNVKSAGGYNAEDGHARREGGYQDVFGLGDMRGNSECSPPHPPAQSRSSNQSPEAVRNQLPPPPQMEQAPPDGASEVPGEHEVVQLHSCATCDRKFNEKALARHEKLCSKGPAKRTEFKASRVPNEAVKIAPDKKAEAAATKKAAKKGAAWKQKSSQLQQAMQAAREIKQAKEEGREPVFAAVEPTVDPSLVPCPHCGRSFNETAAERHIPKCTSIKARPKMLKRGGGNGLGQTAARTIDKEPKKAGVPKASAPKAALQAKPARKPAASRANRQKKDAA
jgi:hypothetical protein